MIDSFRSRDLQRFWEKGISKGLKSQHIRKIGFILDMLDRATRAEDMNIARLDFHKLTGEQPPRWSIHVNGNWCITFSFKDEDAIAVDYEDYH